MIKVSIKLFILSVFFSVFIAGNTLGQRKVERLGRGVVAVNRGGGSIYVSWRLLASDPDSIAFNVYRSIGGAAATKLNSSPIIATTDYSDNSASTSQSNTYYVVPVIGGVEQAASGSFTASLTAKSYISLPLQPLSHYSANHVYVGDLNGDGEYDYIVKRLPANSYYNVMLEAYLNNGTFLWRIDLGKNMEQGASTHNPFVLVYDFDCDGRAEVLTRSGEGTKFADGTTLGDMNGDGVTDYRTFPPTSDLGYMLLGDNCPEFISMVNGMTGVEITRTNYIARGPKSQWDALWGDSYGHRMNFNFAGVAYFDGIHPSIIASRGDGGSMDVAAWDFTGSSLTSKWTWTSRGKTFPNGQHWVDFHNIRILDLDGDGKDEVSWGVCAMDDNGTPLYLATSDVGHGDRFVVADIDPDRDGLECYAIQQATSALAVLYDAKSGERIRTWKAVSPRDVGRGDVADINPNYKGLELWSYAHSKLLNCQGRKIESSFPHPALSIWWDGDLLRESLDAAGKEGYNPIIEKWNYNTNSSGRLLSLYNEGGSYSTRSPYAGRVPLYADIMGDWREEIVLMNSDSTELRIFSTWLPTTKRIYCLMQNPEYRLCVNLKAYLPSTETDFYLGDGMTTPPMPPVLEAKCQWKGGQGGNVWDINTTANWTTKDVASMYNEGDTVMFDISGAGNTSVQLSGNLTPGLIIVNSPVDYTLNGSGSITGTTGLLKSGKGSLTISTPCSYTGITKVDEGALYVNEKLTGSIVHVKRNAKIGGTDTISNVVNLQKGAVVVPGTSTSTGTVTFSAGLTIPGQTVCMFDITDDSTGLTKPSDKINVTGNLTFNDTATVLVNKMDGLVKSGEYPLFTYSGTFAGNLGKIGVKGLFGQKTVVKDSIHIIWLKVFVTRPAGSIVWSGPGNKWDLLTSPNWLLKGNPNVFALGDTILFDATGSGQNNINITGDLPIGKMTVETDNNSYLFTGTGNIGGNGGITKNGSGKFSMLGAENSYTGKTIINSGVFEFTTIDNEGVSSSLGAAAIDPANIVFNNTKVRYVTNEEASTDRGFTINGTQDTIDVVNSGSVLIFGGKVTGGAKLVKAGAGTLYLANNTNNYTGGTVISGGVLQIDDPGSTVSILGNGLVTFNGGTLTMGSNEDSYTTCNLNFQVPVNYTGTLNTDARCNYYGTLTGGGTLNLYLPGTIGRTVFFGNWSSFSGTVNATGVAGSQLRLYNTSGYANTSFNLGANVTMSYNSNSNCTSNCTQTVIIGGLSGAAGSYLTEENWIVGNRNINTSFAGTITGSSVTKVGTGTLTLTGANTYAGGTTVNGGKLVVKNTSGSGTGTGAVTVNSNGTLAGTGIISGAVTVNSGGAISPGDTIIGSLKINNILVLKAGSKTYVDIKKSPRANDTIRLTGKITYGGTLNITQLDTVPFTAGDAIKLFTATSYSGTFTSIVPAAPADGLVWDTTALRTSGTIRVKALQTITFDALTDKKTGDAPFTLTATASSGLPVTYSSSNTDVATINGSDVTIVNMGTTTITASQEGNTMYASAPDVQHTLTVTDGTGIDAVDVLNAGDVRVYPNPVKDKMYLALINPEQTVTIRIENLNGIPVHRATLRLQQNNAEIDMSLLPKGVYLLRVIGNKSIVVKVVKE